MHLTHVYEYKAFDPDDLSGAPFWIRQSLRKENIELNDIYVSPVETLLPPFQELRLRFKEYWHRLVTQSTFSSDMCLARAQKIASQINYRLKNIKTDAILGTRSPLATAFLDTNIPIFYWSDIVFSAFV